MTKIKYGFKQVLLTALTTTAALLTAPAQAYEPSWEGNHPDAKSEAWTWMGHLQELQGSGSTQRLGANGVGFIYYYTRNDSGSMGNMNFRTSSLTKTVDGVGQSYVPHTLYQAEYKNSELRARTSAVDLSFTAGVINDSVKSEPLSAADQTKLVELLKLFPGLKIAPNFAPKKVHFKVSEEDNSKMELDFYSIWPVLSPESGQLRFLGQEGTYTFAEPMLVTVGTYNGKKVAGLSFLDRQWAKDYFGSKAQDGLKDLLKYAHPLKFAHSWSAFHVFNKRTQDWSFFHLWHQWERADKTDDALTDYSGLQWMTNGTAEGHLDSKDYSWSPSGYVQNVGRENLLDYPMGRAGFFPSRADYEVPSLGLKGMMIAQPFLQNLNQPIPFFEGYAAGDGTWNGDPVRLTGRLESSRLLFRTQEYKEMLKNLQAQEDEGWQQLSLQKWLKERIKEAAKGQNALSWIHDRLAVLASMMSEMDLKMAVFGDIMSGEKPAVDPNDKDVMVYR